MLEKDIESRVCRHAKDSGALVYKFSSPANAGVCDRIFIHNGNVWFVEFKRKGLKPTPLQSRHHQELAKQGIAVYVIDSVETGKEIVDHEICGKGHHGDAIRVIGS